MRLVLLIRSLGRGGAERQLLSLAAGLARHHQVTILTYYASDNALASEIDPAVELRVIGKRGRGDVLGFALRAVRAFRALRPDAVYAFLSTASLVSLLARLSCPEVKLVWGLRTANMDFTRFDRLSRWTRAVERRLCRFADLLIANAEAGRAQALQEGFRPRRIEVVHNGIDTIQFRPDDDLRGRVRGELGVTQATPLIGIVARLDPMKGLETFLDAAAISARTGQRWRYVVIASGDPAYRARLSRQGSDLGLDGVLSWLDGSAGVAHLYPALDVVTSASRGEGFSNVIAEAMSCAVPCVVTDVGESAHIVGATGVVVPPQDPSALARAWANLLAKDTAERTALGAAARARIERHFSIPQMIADTERHLQSVIAS